MIDRLDTVRAFVTALDNDVDTADLVGQNPRSRAVTAASSELNAPVLVGAVIGSDVVGKRRR
ncbi:MAG: hypothetical protein IPK66_07590 [Rhodospirillales bacterium]|nr:hypothetical protein [Rhodospirillales bacterium]